MKIYVASSWRNNVQPSIVALLRGRGHDVYDFKNPPNGSGFGWSEIEPAWREKRDANTYLRALEHPRAREGFESDMRFLRGADLTVLVLPCGRSAHLELGFAVGAGQTTIVLLDSPISEWELMYKMCSHVVRDADELALVMCQYEGRR